ncbi:FkbM family methyltransferase [Ectothiorhodospiraceae bacterium WFHF3C12]|nr:FkbM family methyltransferase [Ectothiorhodospiraceae bacterium WFHF3C12]
MSDALKRVESALVNVFPLKIVDIGAQTLSKEPHVYSPLLGQAPCDVVGFEPNEEERNLRAQLEPYVKLWPQCIGDGSERVFYYTRNSGLSSIFPPNNEVRASFHKGHNAYIVEEQVPVRTSRLDDLSREIPSRVDFLKIDVQGGELAVLEGARRTLRKTLVVHTEAFFVPFYVDAPLFSEIDTELRAQGFELIDLSPRGRRYSSVGSRAEPYPPGEKCTPSRLVWAEVIYFNVRLFNGDATSEELRRAAYVADVNYGKYDLSAHLLGLHDQEFGTRLMDAYMGERK